MTWIHFFQNKIKKNKESAFILVKQILLHDNPQEHYIRVGVPVKRKLNFEIQGAEAH